MCTYNGQRFLHEQLDSILNQTYANIELIICDDLSTDNTKEIIQSYMQKDSRIKFYPNSQNLGYIKNFEKAISLCSGEFIALCDQDDIFKDRKIELFIANIKDNLLIYSDAIIIGTDSKDTKKELVRPNRCLISGSCNKALLLGNCISGNTLMFKKELLQHILPIPQEISYHDIWIAFIASTCGTVTYTDEAMTYYRRYPEQVTHSPKVISENFIDKLKQKQDIKIKEMRVTLQDLEILATIPKLKNSNTLDIIKLFIEHFHNYKNIYFNISLYKILMRYNDEVFAILKKSKRKRRAFRSAVGLKLHKLTLFKL